MINILFILRSLVYAQSFLWLYLLDKDYELNNYFIRVLFPVSLGIIYLMLDMSGFSFSQYPNHLLKFYVILMLISYLILSHKYSFKDTVCLTFLVVFINSYYWESMLHFNAILIYGLSFNQFIQMFHLIPSYFLIKRLEFNNIKKVKKILIYGLIFSLLNLLSLNFLPLYIFGIGRGIYRTYINNFTRFICLILLLTIIIRHTKIKKEGNIKLPFQDNKPN